jgi:hypothetical protein
MIERKRVMPSFWVFLSIIGLLISSISIHENILLYNKFIILKEEYIKLQKKYNESNLSIFDKT